MRDYLVPCPIRVDTSGRKLDAAGKLIEQVARPDLKATEYKDPKRKPKFHNV
jgi:hypothetical protein